MNKRSKKHIYWNKMSFGSHISALIFLIGTVAMLLLTIMFQLLYYYSMRQEYCSEVQSRLYDVDTVVNSYVDNITSLTGSLYSSQEGTLARLEKEYDLAEHTAFFAYIRSIMANMEYINSLYFINCEGKINMWIKGGGSYIKDMSRELLDVQLYGRTESPFWWSIPERYNDREIPMLSFFFSETPMGSEKYMGTTLVIVELEEFNKRIFGKESFSTDLMLLNEDGIVILHSNPNYIGEDWAEQPFWQKIISGELFFDEKLDGEHYEFVCIPSQLDGFHVVAQIDSADTRDLMKMHVIVVMIFIMVLLLVAVLSIHTGNCLTVPLTMTVEEISRSDFGKEVKNEMKGCENELQVLQKYTSLVNQYVNEVLENDQKNRIICNLLQNDRSMDIQSFLLEKGILRRDSGYCVVTVKFNCRYDVMDIEEFFSIRKSTLKCLKKIMDRFAYCTCYEYGLRYLLFLLSEENGIEIVVNELEEKLKKACQFMMQENSNTDFYIVISEIVKNINILCEDIVKQNNERMEIMPIYGLTGVELISEYPERERPSEKKVDSCIQALKNGDRESYLQAVLDMLEETRHVSYPQFINWVIGVTERIVEVKSAMHRNYVKTDRSQLYEKVKKIYDTTTYVQWFEVFYDDVNEKIDLIQRTTTMDVMAEAVEYITQNFGDSQLGVTALAKRFHFSAQYFGQKFLNFTGKSVTEYIIQVRMEKARDYLLSRPDMDIIDIAEKVGYNSASYFSTAFKKYYGVTPSGFRSGLHIL